jgi:hypothetical protein
MNISEILARDAEDAWIAKYRKAMEAASIEPPRKRRLDEVLVRACKSVVSDIRRIVDGWRRPEAPSWRARVGVMNSAMLRSAPVSRKKTAALGNDAEPSQIAS